jgi:hypothetical protein
MKRAKCLLPAGMAAVLLCGSAPVRTARAADPSVGDCLSASDTFISLRNQHKLQAARAQALVCAAPSCPAEVRTDCARRVAEINAAIPSIVFEAKDPAGNDLSAVRATLDGKVVTEKLDGTALILDPGEHAFTFETAGQPTLQKSFVIREAEKDRHEKLQFGTPVSSGTGGTESKGGGGTTIIMADTGDSSKKTVAFIVGGVGIAGLIAGGAVLALAFSEKNKSNNDIDPRQRDNDYNASVLDQTIAYIVGGVGVAALGTGIVLLVTSGGGKAPNQDAPKATVRFVPDVAPGRAGLGLVGTF